MLIPITPALADALADYRAARRRLAAVEAVERRARDRELEKAGRIDAKPNDASRQLGGAREELRLRRAPVAVQGTGDTLQRTECEE